MCLPCFLHGDVSLSILYPSPGSLSILFRTPYFMVKFIVNSFVHFLTPWTVYEGNILSFPRSSWLAWFLLARESCLKLTYISTSRSGEEDHVNHKKLSLWGIHLNNFLNVCWKMVSYAYSMVFIWRKNITFWIYTNLKSNFANKYL